jgi:UDPglucose 6-dehydrogenase
VVSCPEFLAQGSAIHNFLYPDRIVIGTDCQSAFEKVKELYASIISSEHRYKVPVLFMNSSSAELTKYAANLFLAMKISYVNEISRIAELVDADIVDVIHAMITDKRIGKGMSHPGCGFGGSCFSKDLKALIYQSQELGYTPALIKSAFEVNESHKKYFIEKVFELCGDAVNGKTIAVWGLAFKANTDDLRDSISCQMIEALLKQGAIVHAFDPAANLHAKEKFHSYPNFKVFSSKNQAVEGANLLVVMTEWPEFLDLDVEFMIRSMKNPILVDGRNIYDPQFLTKQGLSYFAIGKGFIHAIG